MITYDMDQINIKIPKELENIIEEDDFNELHKDKKHKVYFSLKTESGVKYTSTIGIDDLKRNMSEGLMSPEFYEYKEEYSKEIILDGNNEKEVINFMESEPVILTSKKNSNLSIRIYPRVFVDNKTNKAFLSFSTGQMPEHEKEYVLKSITSLSEYERKLNKKYPEREEEKSQYQKDYDTMMNYVEDDKKSPIRKMMYRYGAFDNFEKDGNLDYVQEEIIDDKKYRFIVRGQNKPKSKNFKYFYVVSLITPSVENNEKVFNVACHLVRPFPEEDPNSDVQKE